MSCSKCGDYPVDVKTHDNELRAAGCGWVNDMLGLSGCGCKGGCGAGTPTPGCDPYKSTGGPPTQGPTDETLRCAGCNWVTNVIGVGAMDGISIGGRRVPGFALGAGASASTWATQIGSCPGGCGVPNAPASGDIYALMTAAQQQWVQEALNGWFNDPANATAVSGCNITGASTSNIQPLVSCFQGWFNALKAQGGNLRSDGVFDDMTRIALQSTVTLAAGGGTPASTTPATSNTGYYIAGGAVAVVVIGGIIYAMGKKKPAEHRA